MKVGYQRVSTADQNLDRQDLGEVDRIFSEKISGKNTDRAALQEMIAFCREGDEVVVYSIDRLARDLRDLQNIVEQLNNKGVRVTFITERLSFSADDEDALSKLQLQMLAAFSEYERKMILKRQREGIAKAKARGVYLGRRATIDADKIKQLKSEGLNVTEIARQMGISRQSVYRLTA